MKEKIKEIIHKLSSKSVMQRKKAIKELAKLLHHPEAHLARLSLYYVSIHDPYPTVRNLARQVCSRIGKPCSAGPVWEKTIIF